MEFDKKELARKNVKVTGYVIIFCVTILSIVSTYSITKDGWADQGSAIARVMGFANVIVIEGAFLWLLRGYAVAFSGAIERLMALAGMLFYGAVMITNIILHYRLVKQIPLNEFEQGWASWGVVAVIGVTLGMLTIINLADPKARETRQQLRVEGRLRETVWNAKELALDSDRLARGVEARAEIEADAMIDKLLGTSLPSGNARLFDRPQLAHLDKGKDKGKS